VRLWLIPHASVAYLIPIFAVAALFFGFINGLITAKLLYNKTQPSAPVKSAPDSP